MRNILTLTMIILPIYGCQSKENRNDFDASAVTKEISIRATSELLPVSKISKPSFAPKEFANWTSQILLLDDTGAVYSTNTGFGRMEAVSDGPFKDITGLSRGDNPSVFLAVTPSGDLKAFQEDETGDNFKAIALSSDGQKYAKFCHMEAPDSQFFYGILGDGKIVKTSYSANEEVVELTNSGVLGPHHVQSCTVNQAGQLFYIDQNYDAHSFEAGKSIRIDTLTSFDKMSALTLSDQSPALLLTNANSDGLFVWNSQDVYKLNVEAGLSIDGIARPAWVSTTSASMGSTFNKGLTLIGDQDSSRIVMVSNEYLMKDLQKASSSSAD